MHFAESMHAFTGVVEHHACTVCTLDFTTSAYEFQGFTLATGCAYARMYVQFLRSALGNEDGGVQLVYKRTFCLAWGFFF